jgi:hypothetical protein
MKVRGVIFAAAAAALVALVMGGSRVAAAAQPGRRVLGTVRIAGSVEGSLEPDRWMPLFGGAVVEGLSIRTGEKAGAVLQLSNGDLIGLTEGTTARVGTGTPLHVSLEGGKIAFRLQPGSTTVLDTPQGAARLPSAQPASTGGGQYEALLEYSGGSTSLQSYRGNFELVGSGDIATPVESGQRATLAANSTTPTIVLADSSGTPPGVGDSDDSNQKKGGDATSSLPFGLSPLWATVIGVAVLGGIGGGIAAAASGGGGGSSSSSDVGGGGGNQGSPFRATRTASD